MKTRGRFTNRVGPNKRIAGPHVFDTEVQTLDEALEIIRYKRRNKRANRPMTLKRELAGNRLRQMSRSISLSDRVEPSRLAKVGRKEPPKGADVVWTREQVIAAHATGMFKITDLAKRAKVVNIQISLWVHGMNKPPVNWCCHNCHRVQTSARMVQAGLQPTCTGCGKLWHDGLLP